MSERMNETDEDLSKNDWEEELRQDAYSSAADERAEAKRDWELRNDFDKFVEHYEDEFKTFNEALVELKRIHAVHEQDFDIGDCIW